MPVQNLKVLREKLGLTISEIATRMDVSQSTIINWESNSDNMSIGKLKKYSEALGLTLEDLFKAKDNTIKPIRVVNNEPLTKLRSNLKKELNILQTVHNGESIESAFQNNDYYTTAANKISDILFLARKPSITFVGPSDAGKSTMINTLLGNNEILKTHWSPATSITIHINHTDDKPKFLQDNTVIMKHDTSETPIQAWQLNNKEFFKKHLVDQGDRDILYNWGDREGSEYETKLMESYTIFTYVNSDLLKNAELVDTPGINASNDEAGQMDESLSIYSQTDADIVIYLSPINQFMHTSDTAYLTPTIKRLNGEQDYKNGLSAWHNFFAVASQASIVPDTSDQNNILVRGAHNLAWVMGDEQFDKDNHYTMQDFESRFFTFARDNNEYSNQFMENLAETLKKKQELNLQAANTELSKFKNEFIKLLNNAEEKLLNDAKSRDNLEKALTEAENNLPFIKQTNKQLKKEILAIIPGFNNISHKDFNNYYNSTITENNLVKLLEKRNVSNRKESKKAFVTWLGQLNQDKLEKFLKKNGEDFAEEVKKLSDDAQKRLSKIEQVNFNSNINKFDYKSLIGGVAGAGVVGGAFMLLAGSISSNLGLYITVAQLGGILTNLGVISSPLVATSAVSATGGPVGWIISLSILTGMGISWLISSSTWKTKFAKQIIKAYEKENAKGQFEEAIGKYWSDTVKSTHDMFKTIDSIKETEIKNYKERLKALMDEESIKRGLKQLRNLIDIIESLGFEEIK